MALRLVHDQNINIHSNGVSVVGKENISKAPKKAGIGGRKPLGDLSNSVAHTQNQTSKKENSRTLSFTEKDIGPLKLANESSTKKTVPKASENVQAGSRKALSDISNSGKPHCLQETSKKNQTAKLSILAEEDSNQCIDIAEEGFLHNHEECVKAQKRAISTNEFLRLLGLDDFCKHSASGKEHLMSNKMEPLSPPRHFEPEDMTRLLIEDLSPPKYKITKNIDSAPASPEPLDHYTHWDDPKYLPSFKLIESP